MKKINHRSICPMSLNNEIGNYDDKIKTRDY